MCFGEYGLAMKRKLAIAEYHYGELLQAPRQPDDHGLPPIPLQAHFEAAGRAIGSMPDQLASGIVETLEGAIPGLPRVSNAFLHTVLDALDEGSLRSLIAGVIADVRYSDLRAWRNRATHRFDKKAAVDGVWIVAPPDGPEPFVEPRDVESYVLDAALGFGRLVLDIAPESEALAVQLRESARKAAT
jgi:hypothetical protein